MNLIEIKSAEQMTPEEREAMTMHEQLVLHCQMIEVGLAGMCRALKEMRDKKLYVHLGYEDFGAYTEEQHGIKQRQAYKYIQIFEKLGAEFLHSSAKMGVTKLLEIAALDKDEREELLNEHTADELSAMSTDEVRRLTEQVKKLEDQISFLEKENAPLPSEVIQQPFDEVKAEIEEDVRYEIEEQLRGEYESRIAELEERAADQKAGGISDEEFVKFKANAEKEAKATAADEVKRAKEESAEELKKLKADLKAAKDVQKTKDEAIKKAEEAQKAAEEKAKAGEDALKRAAELEAKIATAEAEKEAVEKQIKLSADPELTRFKFMFEAWQSATSALAEQLSKLDADKQTKTKTAIKTVLEGAGL